MSARYEARSNGVWDHEHQRLVVPGGMGWHKFQSWIAEGNAPDPDSTPTHVPSAEEIAAQAEQDARRTIAAALRQDAALQALRLLTPAQVDSYIDANVVDLASVRVVLKRLAKIVVLLARERLT